MVQLTDKFIRIFQILAFVVLPQPLVAEDFVTREKIVKRFPEFEQIFRQLQNKYKVGEVVFLSSWERLGYSTRHENSQVLARLMAAPGFCEAVAGKDIYFGPIGTGIPKEAHFRLVLLDRNPCQLQATEATFDQGWWYGPRVANRKMVIGGSFAYDVHTNGSGELTSFRAYRVFDPNSLLGKLRTSLTGGGPMKEGYQTVFRYNFPLSLGRFE